MNLLNDVSYTWLYNLKKLDSKNKLRHGEFYSKDGSVHDLKITKNNVESKVMGAPGYDYKVEIKFKPFTKNEIKILKDAIKNSPIIYSKVLNNELSEELFQLNIKLFPDSIKDFKMSCTCNKGLFCKHKAAVFHKISHEISKNPFLIFLLKGFDINDLVQNDSYNIKGIEDILKNNEKPVCCSYFDDNYLNNLFYTLSDYPSFFPSNSINFNEIIHDTLYSMSECSNQIYYSEDLNEYMEYIILGNSIKSFEYFKTRSKEDIKNKFEEKWLNPQLWPSFKINIDGNYGIDKIENGGYTDKLIVSDLIRLLFGFFAEISQIDFDNYCDDIQILHEIYQFTLNLIRLNALIPDLFKLENNEYCIRWIPIFDEEIYNYLYELCEKCPEDLLMFKNSSLSKLNQVICLISLFFKGFSSYYLNKYIPHKLSAYKNETYFRLFFIKSQDFSTYNYKGKEIEVNNWISPLYLSQKNYSIIINTEQFNGGFILNLKIKLDGDLYDFEDIVNLNKVDIIKNLAFIQNIFLRYDIDYDFSNDIFMDLKTFLFFYDNLAERLVQYGVEVNKPSEFSKVNNAKLVLNLNSSTASDSLSLDDLVDFDWKIAIGDESFSINDFNKFRQDFRGLVKVKDKFYVLSHENLEQLSNQISKIPENQDKSSLMGYLLSSDSDNVVIDEKLENFVDNLFNVEDINVPKNLKGDLRHYQRRGFSWLVQNLHVGFGSILADDMGLGKTIQILSLILYLKDNGDLNGNKTLITVPTSILSNWAMEIEKFAPSLKYYIYHGSDREFPKEDYDILLTSYGMLRSDIKKFMKHSWFLFVIDEAQNIKNPKTKQTKAVKSINANHHIALSGTPIENHLGEYWSIFDFTNKGYLDSLKNFKQRFIKPIENHDLDVLNDFKNITSPFILRRLKTDNSIIKELPDKFVNDVYCNLTVKQASLYDETLNVLLKDVEGSEGIQRKGLVLKLINSLKQICNHPSQFLKIKDAKISESGKMEVLINILETILENGEKVLIFTQYVQMGKLMKKLLEEKFNEEVLFLHGGIQRKNRDKMIDSFQNGKNRIFILSIKAGGVGLNLTAASNVIHYDLWWNPAVENQATDRAYRIGQTDNVMVYRFITKGTLEERINQLIHSKLELVDMALSSKESFITEMSDEELKNMLDLRSGDIVN